MNINEVQRSNGVTRRNLVAEWCDNNNRDTYPIIVSLTEKDDGKLVARNLNEEGQRITS